MTSGLSAIGGIERKPLITGWKIAPRRGYQASKKPAGTASTMPIAMPTMTRLTLAHTSQNRPDCVKSWIIRTKISSGRGNSVLLIVPERQTRYQIRMRIVKPVAP